MNDDPRVDGNALAGELFELFGREMTDELGCCGSCGAVNALGAVHVYLDAPGHVLRCPACQSVLMVITTISTRLRLSLESIRWIEVPAS